MIRFQRHALMQAALCVLIAACTKSDSSAAADSSSTETAATDTAAMNAAVAQQPGTGTTAPVTVDDIARWQKGMEAELKAVQAAGERFKAARNSKDSLDNMMGSNEMSTLEVGASAAGLNPERYKFVRSTLSTVALALSPLELEAKGMPPEFAEQMKQNGASTLSRMTAEAPPELVEAMRPRALELRKQHTDLVAARLRAAGMTQ
jgi:hypothetical protein